MWIILLLNAIFFGFIIIYYFYNRNKTFLILGLSGSGKTRLWRSMTGMEDVTTTTSLKTNIGKRDDNVWIDVPGHEKLWKTELAKIKVSEDLIIYFLIDATTFARNRKIVATRLYQVSRILAKYKTIVRIKLTKENDQMALEREKIMVLLDKELDFIRKSKDDMVDLDQEDLENFKELDFCFESFSEKI